jgi:hypothetical protein
MKAMFGFVRKPRAAVCKTEASVVSSARGVILPGHKSVDVDICMGTCADGLGFLVQGIHVGPELIIGSTGIDVLQLPPWGVSVPVFQDYSATSVQVALTGIAAGPSHVSLAIGPGQKVLSPGPLKVTILLLGGVAAVRRFEFNIHVWGYCGKPFVCRH